MMTQRRVLRRFLPLAGVLAIAACDAQEDGVEGYNGFERFVSKNRVGTDADVWIEMKNITGEWEKTGLIFGYLGDYDECQKAIAGLKQVNDAREYRCVPANSKE